MSLRYFTFTLSTDCDHCGNQMPLNGPTRKLTCSRCLKVCSVTPARWCSTISLATQDTRLMGDTYKCVSFKDRNPRCEKCNEHFKLDQEVVGEDKNLFCPSCGDPISTFPAPDLLRKEIPSAKQLVGAERENLAKAAEGPGVKDSDSKPVRFTCPECNASLRISKETERVANCEYCEAQVFLPDGLWLRLHPVKTTQPWTIIYSGKGLKTREQLKEAAEEKREEREEKKQEKRKKNKEKLEDLLKERRKIRNWWGYLNGTAWLTPLGALLLLFALLAARCSGVDPTGGIEGNYVCNKVCVSCTGPFRTVTVWTPTRKGQGTNGPQYFCHSPVLTQGVSDEQLESNVQAYSQYEASALVATSLAFLMSLVVATGFMLLCLPLVIFRQAKKGRAIDSKIAALVESLKIPKPNPVSPFLFGGVVFFAAMVALPLLIVRFL